MRTGLLLLTLLVVILLATVPEPRYISRPWQPDFFAILVVFISLRADARRALPLCWLAGLSKDLFSAGQLGQFAMLYLVSGLLIAQFRQARGWSVLSIGPLLTFVTVLVTESVAAWSAAHDGLLPIRGAFSGLAGQGLMTALTAWPVLLIFDSYLRPKSRKRLAANWQPAEATGGADV
jgi:rod shape-determining protein MreD